MRVLVSPASKHGGTAEIGRAIATTLRGEGIDVDVSQPADIHDLSHYQGFVIGSAVYLGEWLPAASAFVTQHSPVLTSKPTWLFSSGPLGEARPEEPVHPEVIEQLVTTTGAIEHRLFSGRLRLDDLGRTERFVAKWVGAPSGDFREWDQIGQWARAIASELRQRTDNRTQAADPPGLAPHWDESP